MFNVQCSIVIWGIILSRFPPGKVAPMKRLPFPALLLAFLVVSAGFVTAQIATDPNLVYLHGGVIDNERGRPIRGISAQQFRILEDNKPQDIVYFSQNDVPLAVGILIDFHGDMKDRTKAGMDTLTRSLTPQDQFFVAETGDTGLNDAVYQNLNRVLQLQSNRRALVLVTDRTDPDGYVFSKVKELLRSQDIQFYSIVASQSGASSPDHRGDKLRELCEESGGISYFPFSIAEANDIGKKIAAELKNQYVIGYRPTNQARDGKWRKIKVTAEVPDDKNKVQKLTARTKSGYYAPATGGSSSAKN
jgi:Ca-activated chloride channel family protein